MKKTPFISKTILILLFLLLSAIMASLLKSPIKQVGAQIYFLNVGQGDSILIQKDNYQILIDGGPDDSVLPLLGENMPTGDRKIEAIILTHPHADHIVGLNQILDRYEVGTIYGTGVVFSSAQYLSFLDKIKSKKIDFQVPQTGDRLTPFDFATLDFIWPGRKYLQDSIENVNNSSIVTKFCYYQKCALLTGDIEKEEQDTMLAYYKDNEDIFKAEIYKVPHHGSNTGVNEAMYEKIIPKYSIISCGEDNKYGHPHQASIALAQKFNTTILRTDQNGTIKFNLDENLLNYSVK